MARRAGFVEADVSGATDAENLQVDAARPSNLLFVADAIVLGVFGVDGAIGHIDVLWRNVDVIEERLLHPTAIALGVVRLHGEVFVEVEGDDVREVEVGLAVQANEFAVQADGRGAGWQAENGGPAGAVVLADEALDHQRDVPRRPGAGGKSRRRDLGMRHDMGGHRWASWGWSP